MGLVDSIKNQVKKSGSNKGKILYFKEGNKVRIRFLQDMDDGMKITFHDSFDRGINVPCQEIFGRDCPYCGDDELRHRDLYCWSVWDHDSKETKLLLAAVNNCSPIPPLVGMYDAYGSLIDRDYVITKSGKQQNTSYSVVPMDKAKFRNEKAKPFSEQNTLKLIDNAFPIESDDEDEDEKPKKKKPAKTTGKAKPKKVEEPEDDEDEEEATDYDDMSPKELYALCKEREIEVKPKQKASYYIDKLQEYDETNDDDDDWGDDDDEDGEDW